MEPTNKPPVKWYYRSVPVIIAILLAGPFALPLVWKSPAFNRGAKAAITIIVLLLTAYLTYATFEIYKTLLRQLEELQRALSG